MRTTLRWTVTTDTGEIDHGAVRGDGHRAAVGGR